MNRELRQKLPIINYGRQVHLDFHTSPYITDVGVEFDVDRFVDTLRHAHVNSVTLFAKCHHGMCYYPTKVGVQHPALRGRDLLGEQIEALRRAGMRVAVYTTVAWEEDVAGKHPEWRQIRRDGTFAVLDQGPDGNTRQPGQWKFNNFLHPEYQSYIYAHVCELLAAYDVDGLFFDILFFHPDACWSEASRAFRERIGQDPWDESPAARAQFETAAQVDFASRFTRLIQDKQPGASVFYNAPNPILTDSTLGVPPRLPHLSHWEIESLPSGFWGYHHFPRLARTARQLSKPWVGVTGRFQKMWGDFGGIKPRAALEYECFRTQALGGASMVGDQLPPRGRLEIAAYDLVGSVFKQVAEAEAFYAGAKPIPQIAIVAPGHPEVDAVEADLSLEGALQLCDEMHCDAAVVNDASDLSDYDLIVLPDSVVPTPRLAEAVKACAGLGKTIVGSHRSGFIDGRCAMFPSVLNLRGTAAIAPSYWRASEGFDAELAKSDRVIYSAGLNVEVDGQSETWIRRVLPYFARTDVTFCSHFHAPPRRDADAFPAAVGGPTWAYFADPVFREYRQKGNTAVAQAMRAAFRRLIGPPPFGDGLPATMLMVPARRGRDLIITLLHYVPQRKAIEVDVIDEPMGFAGDVLRLPKQAGAARIFGTKQLLRRRDDGAFELPVAKGRLLIEVPSYFES